MTASSVPATVRNTTPLAASGVARPRLISLCRPTNSSPIPRSGLADGRHDLIARFHHERTYDLPAAECIHALARTAVAKRRGDSFFLFPPFRGRRTQTTGGPSGASPALCWGGGRSP